MKRRRNSTTNRGRGRGKVRQIYYLGPSFSHLPNNILVTVLLSLSIKSIFVCKCACKGWYDLISDPHFAKLHFDQTQVYPLLRTWRFTILSRMLYLVQPDDFDMCSEETPIKIKLDFKLKLPLRNIQMILDKEASESENSMKLNMRNHKYDIVNSCNGLLCLSNSSNNDPLIVFNPVTGEFINLPEVRTVNNDPIRHVIYCGFGFSPATNQYKVIRMYSCSSKQNTVMVAEVRTLDTDTWKAVHLLPNSCHLSCPTYLDGCVYWLSCDYYRQLYSITCFDVRKEYFESIPIPTSLEFDDLVESKNIGVLGGELFISISRPNDVCVWAMKDNGANKSWSQIFSFQSDKLSYSSCRPMKFLNHGALLLFDFYRNAFICKDPRKTGFRYLKVHVFGSKVKVIAHIPSFVPLKHALSGHNVKVLNVKSSRCVELKVDGEEQVISIVEEDMKEEQMYDSD